MKPIYARVYQMASLGNSVPPPPTGYDIKRVGAEMYRAEGGISKYGEPVDFFLDRFAKRIELAFFVYAQGPNNQWMTTAWWPRTGWDKWEECVEPQAYPDTTEEE